MKKIRVAICDDLRVICVNFQNMLNHQQNFDFAGYCTDSAACIEMVKKHDIDILLLDVQIENAFSGITLIPQLLAIAPELKIIMLTGYSSSDYIFEAITNGASDYVIKECSMEEILNKIKAVYEGQVLLSEEISKKFISKSRELSTAHKSLIYVLDKMVMLSGGERDVLKDLYNGKTYNEIAESKCVEAVTVRSMGSRILKKFGESNMNYLIMKLKQTKVFEIFYNE